jgi:hypothetical protein
MTNRLVFLKLCMRVGFLFILVSTGAVQWNNKLHSNQTGTCRQIKEIFFSHVVFW